MVLDGEVINAIYCNESLTKLMNKINNLSWPASIFSTTHSTNSIFLQKIKQKLSLWSNSEVRKIKISENVIQMQKRILLSISLLGLRKMVVS